MGSSPLFAELLFQVKTEHYPESLITALKLSNSLAKASGSAQKFILLLCYRGYCYPGTAQAMLLTPAQLPLLLLQYHPPLRDVLHFQYPDLC